MATKLKKLIVNRVDLVDAGDNPTAHVLLYKRKETASMPPKTDDLTPIKKAIDDAVAEAVAKAAADAKTEHDAFVAELAKLAPVVEPTIDDIDKSKLDPAVRKVLDEQAALVEKAQKDATEAIEKAAKLEDAAAEARFSEIAKGLPFITAEGVDAGSVKTLLRTVSEKAPDVYESLSKALDAAQKKIAMGEVLKTHGVDGDSDAAQALAAAVADIKKNDPTMSDSAARVAAVKADPSLREAYAKPAS